MLKRLDWTANVVCVIVAIPLAFVLFIGLLAWDLAQAKMVQFR